MEKECLAVVWAVEKFRPYLEGHPVTLETDHQPLVWLHSMKKPSPKMLRWILRLEEFQLEVRYRPGRENKVADCLSRRVPGQEGEVAALQVEIHGSWSKDQEDDDECQTFRRKWCAPGKDPAKAAPFLVQKGVLYNVSRQGHLRLVVPESRRKEVLETHHDHPSAGHSGVQRTLEKIQRNFFWSRMRQDVEGYVKTCEVCQKHKVDGKPPMGKMEVREETKDRWEHVSIDLVGPLPRTPKGFVYILSLKEHATKWVELFPLRRGTAVEIAETLANHVFLYHGMPRSVTSDNGTQFAGKVMRAVCNSLGIKQVFTASYHPQANADERTHRELRFQLASRVAKEHQHWDRHLGAIAAVLRDTRSESTGFTPNELVYGRNVMLPYQLAVEVDPQVCDLVEWLPRLQENLASAKGKVLAEKKRAKTGYDKKRRDPPKWQVGDLVLVRTHPKSSKVRKSFAKWNPKWEGPYVLAKQLGPVTWLVKERDGGFETRQHLSNLRPFEERAAVEGPRRSPRLAQKREQQRSNKGIRRDPQGSARIQKDPQGSVGGATTAIKAGSNPKNGHSRDRLRPVNTSTVEMTDSSKSRRSYWRSRSGNPRGRQEPRFHGETGKSDRREPRRRHSPGQPEWERIRDEWKRIREGSAARSSYRGSGRTRIRSRTPPRIRSLITKKPPEWARGLESPPNATGSGEERRHTTL